MKHQDTIIIVLLVIIGFLIVFNMSKSYFSPAPASTDDKVRDMVASGKSDAQIAVVLIRDGMHPDEAVKLINLAKTK